jgi:hypothetical protein
MDKFARWLVNDKIVADFVSEDDDIAVLRANDAVAVLHWCIGSEISPVADDPVAEISLTENLFGFLSSA